MFYIIYKTSPDLYKEKMKYFYLAILYCRQTVNSCKITSKSILNDSYV